MQNVQTHPSARSESREAMFRLRLAWYALAAIVVFIVDVVLLSRAATIFA